MNENLCFALGIIRDWIDAKGNLHTSQMRASFRSALIIGAEYILRVHGLAKNPGLFPMSRMEVAPLMGLDEAVVKRAIPIWIRMGLLRQMSILTRRRDDFLELFPTNPDRPPLDVMYCPHQYLLGETFERIFGLKDGTKIAEPPIENQSGQERFSNVSELSSQGRADSEPDLSRWYLGVSVRFSGETQETPLNLPTLGEPRRQSSREPEFEASPWDTSEPQSLTEALKLLQTAIQRLNTFPSVVLVKPTPAHERAQEAVRKAEGWVALFEAVRMPVKPLSAEAMRSSMRLAPFRR